MRTLKLTIAYDGTAYAGWQFQLDRPTVQETLENGLEKVTGEQIRVLASGRTDAGVHALGQVVACRPPRRCRRRCSAGPSTPTCPRTSPCWKWPSARGLPSHQPRRRKRYRYVIHDGPVRDVFSRHYAWHYIHGRLDAAAMQRAAAALLGTHDFRSFETAGARGATSVRTVFDLHVRRGRAGQGRERD